MASPDDSLEYDIWDYKPALKKQGKSMHRMRSSASKSTCLNTSQSKAAKHPKSTVKTIDNIQHRETLLSECESQNDNKVHEGSSDNPKQVQVIDVDLEPEEASSSHSELALSKSSSSYPNKPILQSSSQTSSAPKDLRSALPSQTNASLSKNVGKKRCSDNLTVSKNKSPLSKSRRTSSRSRSGSDEKKCMPSIATYFSPKKSNSKTMGMSYLAEDIIDLSDEDFEKLDKDITKVDQETAYDGACHSKKQPEQIDNVGLNPQNTHQTPLVNVDIIVDDEEEQSSFELENRSGIPLGKVMNNSESLNSECHSSITGKQHENASGYGLMSENYALTLTCATSSNGTDEETKKYVASDSLLTKESGSDTDDLFSENEEDIQSKVSLEVEKSSGNSTSKSSLSPCKVACDDKSVNNPSENGGGFLPEADVTETDVRQRGEPTISIVKPTSDRVPLLSSTTWPTMTSCATKQTTLFSFIKAKPKMETPSNQEPLRPKFTKSISGSSAWKSQDSEGTTDSNTFRDTKKKQCPFYKKIPGTPITVDAFRYGIIPGCEAYILTHFHYDHYGGLTKKFSQPIFCSQVTGNLVESRIGVHNKWINRLPLWKPCKVANATLTLMEANHCPGAVIILFELKDGRKFLHTGDFRANPDMEKYSALQGIKISELYLDTTYCNPSYAFPDQTKVVHFVVDLVLNYISNHPSTLIVCGAYTIGKERIFQAIAKAIDSKICVMNDKKKVLDCLEDPDLKSRVTLDWSAGCVHVLPMGKLNQQHLKEHHSRHHQFENILAFQPTGWTHSDKQISLAELKPKWSKDKITLYVRCRASVTRQGLENGQHSTDHFNFSGSDQFNSNRRILARR
ncbi:DNA cross-link repair 1A protein [Elysia marginata]|uniref:DNA cross-link repair 1A protein n=1 Tax=Elysia marginata TaxID=1093978 RepID=A0AAV4IR64_9GAST|nr:DNA cross-link repair 1A protein [Elysia marginata]